MKLKLKQRLVLSSSRFTPGWVDLRAGLDVMFTPCRVSISAPLLHLKTQNSGPDIMDSSPDEILVVQIEVLHVV